MSPRAGRLAEAAVVGLFGLLAGMVSLSPRLSITGQRNAENRRTSNAGRDILLSEGYIRRADLGSYRSTCYPAWF